MTTAGTVITRVDAAALILFFVSLVRRLLEGGAYLKVSYRKDKTF